MNEEKLLLFFKPTCPFCRKVLKFLEHEARSIPLCDISADPKNREKLLRLGAKVQVPCLLINKKPLYESDDIIEWLRVN